MMQNDFSGSEKPRVALCAVELPGDTGREASLEELARLVDTAGGVAICVVTQPREAPDVRTCLGKGKVEELKALCENEKIDLVVFDCELTPSQIRNVEDVLDGPSVIDRSMLILDIFAKHAVTREGKLQVELAQLGYTVPRLIGKGKSLSRQGGSIGSRGPGESQLETDKRHVHRRMDALRAALAEIEKNRGTMRASRDRSGIPKVAIAGYTNAGKSTLTNSLCDADILAEDKLFATLDPTTRRFILPDGSEILLTDTVGFIRNLPHKLISAFRSTLEEVKFADLVLVVVDSSDPEAEVQTRVTEQLLVDLEADKKPRIYVFNKIDVNGSLTPGVKELSDGVYSCAVSARTGAGLDELAELLQKVAYQGKRVTEFFFPYAASGELNRLMNMTPVTDVKYEDEGTRVTLTADEKTRGMFAAYLSE